MNFNDVKFSKLELILFEMCIPIFYLWLIIFFSRNEKREMQEMQEELEDLRDCGLGSCKPAFLQSCANIKV